LGIKKTNAVKQQSAPGCSFIAFVEPRPRQPRQLMDVVSNRRVCSGDLA
jgi:hypothetical protein